MKDLPKIVYCIADGNGIWTDEDGMGNYMFFKTKREADDLLLFTKKGLGMGKNASVFEYRIKK